MLLRAFILPLSYFKRSWLFGVVFGLILIGFGLRLSTAHAASVNSAKNCDANAVIWCGVNSSSDLVTDYNNGDNHNTAASIQNIYSFYGINPSDITAIKSGSLSVEQGSVTSSGIVSSSSGTKLASAAITGGRQDMAGSTKEDVNGTIFYERTPSVSFAEPTLPALIVMKNGQFDFAILTSCGNPIKATPVKTVAPTPTPKPTPVKPTPTPVAKPTSTSTTSVCSGTTTNSNTSVASQGGNCSTNTTVVQTPTVAPATATGACSSLQVAVNPTNTLAVTATANSATSNGAELTSAVFNFGDGVTTPASTNTTQSHTYVTAGNYTITATLYYSATNQTITPSTCQATLSMATPPSTPVSTPVVTTAAATPPTSTTLVNTGPGDVVAIFGLVTLTGSFGYHLILKRHLK